jgi:electron transfer flavoprotein alpha subunit
VSRPLPCILLLAFDSFAEIAETERAEALPLGAAAFTRDGRVEDCGTLLIDPASIPLEEADLIVSAGNGVTDWASFHAVAAGLGAAEAGSRVVCDAGLLPRDRQIGASGVLVAPRCYLAFGIAGAPQHLQGIADCKRVIAVNTDLHAAMVGRADLAIVADAQAVLPALARKLATGPR